MSSDKRVLNKIVSRLFPDGLYTVEMALVFPVLLSFFVLLLYLGFYVHDRFMLEEIARESAMYGAVCGADMSDGIRLAEEKCSRLLSVSFCCIRDVEMEISENGTRVCVSLEGSFQVPVFRDLLSVFSEDYTRIETSAEGVVITPLTIVRLNNVYEKGRKE